MEQSQLVKKYPVFYGTRRFSTMFTRGRLYEGVSRSFRSGHLERELHIVKLSATRFSCIAILLVSLVSFVAITLCVASQRVFIVVFFVIDSVRKFLDTSSYPIRSLMFSRRTRLTTTLPGREPARPSSRDPRILFTLSFTHSSREFSEDAYLAVELPPPRYVTQFPARIHPSCLL
jgi:hypothetical protein